MNARQRSFRFAAMVLIAMLAVPQGAFARFEDTAKPGWDMYSKQQDIQAGQQAAAQVPKQMPLVKDAAINSYVEHLGARLAAHAPEQWPFSFKVVNQKEINAFALPGGPIFVNLGTIQAADNEAELAGVIAHEMSHVILRHSTHMASQQALASGGLALLGGLLGGRGGAGGSIAGLVAQLGVGSVFLHYSRNAEQQADLMGTDIMHDSGFNPMEMAHFFQKLEEQGGSQAPQFLSDHPNPGNRVEYVSAEAKTLQPMQYSQDSAEFRQIKQRVGGMKPMTAQQIQQWQAQGNGNAAGNGQISTGTVAPSRNFKTLQHNYFTIAYPENWQAYGDQTSEVTIAPQGGVSQNAVAYGAIINGFEPENRNTSNPMDDAFHQLIDQMRQGDPNLRTYGRDEGFTLNGRQARRQTLIGVSPVTDNSGRPVKERDELVAVDHGDGLVMYIVFVAPDRDFGRLQGAYEQMLQSFQMR